MKSNLRIGLIGAGIMSATLGVFLKKLIPDADITIFERLNKVGAESSDAWNNAGTGHSAFCELNYTPELESGNVDISKALKISESFEISKQFWASLLENGDIETEIPFINDIDHMSFVWGESNKEFLQKRYAALRKYSMFSSMKYSESHQEIAEWIPLMMEGRSSKEEIASTRMEIGTDVNFGSITRSMIQFLEKNGVNLKLGSEVKDLEEIDNGWIVHLKDLSNADESKLAMDFIFIGAGGGAIPLLEKSDIEEGRGFAGFPVSGQFLVCNNAQVIERHEAKVYGKASEGSPPMSVPHLDTRMLNGKRSLLFGPYAGFSTKFLKNGSYLDLPLSLEVHNIWPLLTAGVQNIGLTKYLISQVVQSKEDRFDFLKTFYPEAQFEDWDLITAGQRVQIIKKDKSGKGVLKFGTEIVTNKKKNIAALLGASPGASTSVSIMLNVLKVCFETEMKSDTWVAEIKSLIPSYGRSLIEDGKLCLNTRDKTTKVLKLN